MIVALLSLVSVLASEPAVMGPYSTFTNFSIDLQGTPDVRATTWGCAGAAQNLITFTVPAGYRVRVLRVTGDFVYWPKAGVIAAGLSSEVGWGLKTTAADGGASMSNAYDNTLIWIQGAALAGEPQSRIHFDQDTSINGLLGADNVLISQTFVAINNTGLVIHMEPTFRVTYQFERLER